MAETVTNLKVRFGADTKNFKADLESGKAAVDNFTGSAKDSFADFASVFGVNMGEVSSQFNTVNKSLNLLSAGFKGSAAASGFLAKAMQVLKLALISTGIGALVVALGSLVTYFTRTERGAEAVQRVMAGLNAVVNVLLDRFALLGEGIYKIFTGDFKAGWETLKGSVKGLGTEIATEAKQAYALEDALQNLEDKENDLITVQSQRKQSIEELRLKAKDLTHSEKERKDAIAEAISIQKQMTADEVALQKERVRIQNEQFNMGEITDEKYRALQESRARLNELEAEGTSTIRGMMREYNSLTKSITEATQAERLAAIEREKSESKDFKKLSPIKLTADQKTGKIAQTEIPAPKIGELETSKLEAKAAKIQSIYGDLKSTVVDFAQVFAESMNSVAVSFGESLGEMLAGSGSLGELGAIVLSSLADLAINVGKIAIGVGIAILGIKKALESLNPFVAIAAGIALVALGTAAKSALSSAASGGTYSSSASTSSYGSGSYGSSSSNVRSAPQTIYITGEFRQRGTDLVAVIDKNSQRRTIGG